MEAKLIKMLEGYIVSLTGDIDDIYAITNKELAEEHGFYSLSLKNCQKIENGYDLYELAKASMNKINILFNNSLDSKSHTIGFRAGWHHAIKILGDKKFSEDDAKRLFELGIEYGHQKGYVGLDYTNDTIQSLQQTEWDVEIVTTTRMENGKSGLDVPVEKPKLDADGCLILKCKI
jgi:hypothetical protein